MAGLLQGSEGRTRCTNVNQDFSWLLTDEIQQLSLGQVSFTADIWSNQSRYPFLAMTGHWMSRLQSGGFQYNSALLVFHQVQGSHNGERLARIVLHLLDRVDVTVKVCFTY